MILKNLNFILVLIISLISGKLYFNKSYNAVDVSNIMQPFSNRHKLVGKLVLTSLAITSIFGINSVFFLFTKQTFQIYKDFEALYALKTSTATDEISTIADLKKLFVLLKNFPIDCENYFALIQTRNRVKIMK